MTRGLKQRLDRLEADRDPRGLPQAIVATRPLPEPPTNEADAKQLAAGEAHLAFRGLAIMYDGGRGAPTVAQWQAEYLPRH